MHSGGGGGGGGLLTVTFNKAAQKLPGLAIAVSGIFKVEIFFSENNLEVMIAWLFITVMRQTVIS